ncbi:MAG TPA: ROK family transcriptional regulator [Thermomicrobiales bacterium]|nr:ROK family transcriptional regulator [Thermomicrobiales bacterium]
MTSPSPFVGANHRSVKQGNRATIFRAIRALGPIARVNLARQSRLNPGTVTNIVDELLDAGLVTETGQGPSRVGRRPVYLEVVPSARYAIGIDIARNAITGALIDLAGRPVERLEGFSGSWLSGDRVVAVVTDLIARLLATPAADGGAKVVGIGVGSPGPLSISSGRILAPPYYGSGEELPLQQEIESRFNLPALVDNNSNTSTLAELWFGAGQGVEDFVLLTLGTGVGSGLVLDGELYRGGHDLAGELGHMSINADGPRCACGNFGCLEMYVSVPRVLAAVRGALAIGEPSALRAVAPREEDLTLAMVFAAVRDGDPLASRVFADVVRRLAAGLVNIVNAFDPELILLGRDLASAGDLLLDPVREEVRRRVFPIRRDAVRIEVAALTDAPTIGAATLALREFFHAPLTR